MIVAKLPNRFDQQKSNRLKKQAKKLAAIMASPLEDWVHLLCEEWPQALPNYVVSRLCEQGYSECVKVYLETVDTIVYLKQLNVLANDVKKTLDQEPERVASLYMTLQSNNPKSLQTAGPMLNFIASLPQPVSVTVSGSDVPLMIELQVNEVIDTEEEFNFIFETQSRTNRFAINSEWTEEMQKYMEGSIVAGLIHRGGLQIRHPLALRVQRANEQGVLEWVHQEKIYAFALNKGQFEPLSVSELTNVYCTGLLGQHWPLDAGTHIGDTSKDFKSFQKRQSLLSKNK